MVENGGRQTYGRQTFFYKRAILIHFPAEMTGGEAQNVDTVIFFLRLHKGIG